MRYSEIMNNDDLKIRLANWNTDKNMILHIRTQVFVIEQKVPEELERDEWDPQMIHVLAFCRGNPVGTARMSKKGHIGRVAVLKQMRGKSIGALMMEELENQAAHHSLVEVHLNAQIQAVGFYERRGYSAAGESFLEAGIPHIPMNKSIVKSV